MLTKDEADSILAMIGGVIIYSPKCEACVNNSTILWRITKGVQHLTENSEKEILEKIEKNVERYFELNQRIKKLEPLDTHQWATNAQLDLAVNAIIKTVNKIIDRLENKDAD